MWYLAGDRSTDINYYTKRHLLAKVYCITELYMIQDKSQGFNDTWEFLDRRLHEMESMLRVLDKQQASGILGSLSIGLSSLASVFSSSNLSMDDSIMQKYQEMLLKTQKMAMGEEEVNQ